jgi:hypothetical protein
MLYKELARTEEMCYVCLVHVKCEWTDKLYFLVGVYLEQLGFAALHVSICLVL